MERTLSRVPSPTPGRPFTARETVMIETPAARATSAIVLLRFPIPPQSSIDMPSRAIMMALALTLEQTMPAGWRLRQNTAHQAQIPDNEVFQLTARNHAI